MLGLTTMLATPAMGIGVRIGYLLRNHTSVRSFACYNLFASLRVRLFFAFSFAFESYASLLHERSLLSIRSLYISVSVVA